MTLVTQPASRSRARIVPAPTSRVPGEEPCRIDLVENPLHHHDPALAAAVEEELQRILRDETLGPVAVRFRVCQDDADGLRFVCKVENPPCVDTHVRMPWRWWSPLVATAQEFAAALEEGLRVRRARMA